MKIKKENVLGLLTILFTNQVTVELQPNECMCSVLISTSNGTLGFVSDGRNTICNVTISIAQALLPPNISDVKEAFADWCLPGLTTWVANQGGQTCKMQKRNNSFNFRINARNSFNVSFGETSSKDSNRATHYFNCSSKNQIRPITSPTRKTTTNKKTNMIMSTTPVSQPFSSANSRLPPEGCTCDVQIYTDCEGITFLADGTKVICNVTMNFTQDHTFPTIEQLKRKFENWCHSGKNDNKEPHCTEQRSMDNNVFKFQITTSTSFNLSFPQNTCAILNYYECPNTINQPQSILSKAITTANRKTNTKSATVNKITDALEMTTALTTLQQLKTALGSQSQGHANLTYGLIGATVALIVIGIVVILILWQRRIRINAAKANILANLQNTGETASPLGVNDTIPIGINRPGNVYEEHGQRELVDNELYQAHGGANERGDGPDYNAAYEMAGPNEKQVVENELYRM